MNQHDDPNAEALEKRVVGMAREIMPERELWPEIASSLTPREVLVPRRNTRAAWIPGNWASIGVALAAGYLLAIWFPMSLGPDRGEPPPQPLQGRMELLASIQPALGQLSAKTRAVVETDLAGFEQDWLRIEQALAAEPENPLLRELWRSAQNRALSVREQIDRLANSALETVEL